MHACRSTLEDPTYDEIEQINAAEVDRALLCRIEATDPDPGVRARAAELLSQH